MNTAAKSLTTDHVDENVQSATTAEARYFTPELAQMFTQANVWITSTGYNRTALHYHHALADLSRCHAAGHQCRLGTEEAALSQSLGKLSRLAIGRYCKTSRLHARAGRRMGLDDRSDQRLSVKQQ
jgi:hypothetical protein